MSDLTVETATDILKVLGYDRDPVYRHGKRTTAAEINRLLRSCPAKHVWVEYHVGGRRKKRGTFYQLLLQRIRESK